MSKHSPEEKKEQTQFLYTPGMIANLLSASVSTIRLLYRRNLLTPVKVVNKLLFFDVQDLYKARHLVSLTQGGFSPAVISRRLEEFKKIFPDTSFSILQLVAAPNGVDLLLNLEGSYWNVQKQPFLPLGPFLSVDAEENAGSISESPVALNTELEEISGDSQEKKEQENLSEEDQEELDLQRDEICQKFFSSSRSIFQFYQEDRNTVRHFLKLHIISLCELAWKLENTNRWEEAADLYRSALIAGGADSSISFQLAELLQRQKDYAGARERYYVVLESDRDNIEARANLGRVLRKQGEVAKAIDAFQGALALYPDYLDVHYELGCLLFQCGKKEEAGEHLRRYLNGSPEGPQTDHAVKLLNSK